MATVVDQLIDRALDHLFLHSSGWAREGEPFWGYWYATGPWWSERCVYGWRAQVQKWTYNKFWWDERRAGWTHTHSVHFYRAWVGWANWVEGDGWVEEGNGFVEPVGPVRVEELLEPPQREPDPEMEPCWPQSRT